MDQEHREKLQNQMDQAKDECSKLWPRIQKLESELSNIKKEYSKWKTLYEKADRQIAEVERKKIVKFGNSKRKELVIKLTVDQIKRIAEALEIEL